MSEVFTATVTFRDKNQDELIKTERWDNCELSDGNVSLDFEFKRLRRLTITPKEWHPIDPDNEEVPPLRFKVDGQASADQDSQGDWKEAPFAGGYTGGPVGPDRKISVRSIRKLVQVGPKASPSPLPKERKERLQLLMSPPSDHAIVLDNGDEFVGEISPRPIALVGTRPSGKREAIQISSLLFLSFEVTDRQRSGSWWSRLFMGTT